MKKVLVILAVIILGIIALTTMRDQSKTVSIGETYRDDGRVVVIEYVGRGDSVLARYPGVFLLDDSQLRSELVVFRSEERLFAQNTIFFKQKFDRVHSTPPAR